jgi:hypothetical protein
MIAESIREGITLTHRNWQIIPIRFIVAIINVFALLIFIGIPVFFAIASLGIDLAQTRDALPGILENPSEIITNYLGIIALLLISVTLYLTIVSVITLYAFGGMLGVLRNSAINFQYRFNLASFFYEAKNLFFPLLWLLSLIFLVINGIVIIFGIFTGLFIITVTAMGDSASTLSVFLGIFLGLILIFLLLIGGLGILIYSVFAIMSMVVEGKGVIDSLKNSWKFIINKPSAILFYIILVLGILGINIVLMMTGGMLRMIPGAGFFLSIPYQFIYYSVQIYLGVVLWSSLVVYYTKGINYPVYKSAYNI